MAPLDMRQRRAIHRTEFGAPLARPCLGGIDMLATHARRLIVLLTLCTFFATGTPLTAQYFGRNKVQYRTFDFQVLRTERFDIYFYPSARAGVEIAARLAERWNARLERLLGHQLRGRQPLILYGSHVDFEQTNVIGGAIGESTGGVTESLRRRIVLPLGGPLADTDHVIGHELVHAFQFDMTTTPDMGPGQTGAHRLPLWFVEGMAEYLSIGPVDPNTAMWLRDAALREELPEIRDLDDPEFFPYRWGQAFWAYVCGRWGDEVIGRMLVTAASLGVDKAIEEVLGTKAVELSADWQKSILDAYEPVLTSSVRTGEFGRVLIQAEDLTAELNVAPSISPDGRWLAFLSTRDFFSVDLYVAETATGRVVRRLTRTATDPHFSSLQFVHSAGAWDRASRRIAVATVTSGRPALAVFDVETGSLVREIVVPDVDEIFNPTWAPNGQAIAFTGLQQGLTDLFVYALDTARLRRLTNDPFAELQPAWSPDGMRIAFSTDRFTSDLSTLSIGSLRLGLIDAENGRVEPVAALPEGKHINPQWSPDGGSIYFISDRGGISNVYRARLGAGDPEIIQVSTVTTGVSGITGESPALSVAAERGIVAFGVYENGKYDILTVDPNGANIPPRELPINAGALPPIDRPSSAVSAALTTPAEGLQEPTSYEVEPYRASLSPDGIAQPVVGVGVSQFGTTFGGGLALSFSDMLGNHQLVTAFQVNSTIGGVGTSFKDIGAQVGYFNRARRWNWGVIGGQVPYLTGGFQSTVGRRPNGDLVRSDQLFVFRQTERSAAGVVSYPLDRSRRVEFQGGASQVSFDQVVRTTTYSLFTGAVFEDSTETTPLDRSLNLGTGSAAFVFDTSVFGATSPVQGQRYRFEASPTFGSLNFTGLLADYRRYFMPARFYTVAVRAMHYGRYGSGGEDSRLFPLHIGYPWLVRGYDVSSIDSQECVPSATSSCALIESLLGSRMLVGNVELRFPLLRPFGVGGSMYGPVPIEVALFADGGTAWNAGQSPSILGGSRPGVSSVGVAFRVNLLGFAIGEIDWVRPLDRPTRGWIFGFNLMPGW
jgi:Tol biopolymer transport system component